MTGFVRNAVVFALLFLAAVIGGRAMGAGSAVRVAREGFARRAEALTRALLENPELLAADYVRKLAAVTGGGVAVFTEDGIREAPKGLVERAKRGLVAAMSDGTAGDVETEGGLFLSVPVKSHLLVRHIFIRYPERVLSPPPMTAREKAEAALLALAAGLVAAFLLHLFYVEPQRVLAKAAGRAVEQSSTDLPYLQARGPIGDLARSFLSSITKLKRAQKDLLASEKIAVFNQLTVAIAHEVRNPLTAMRMTAQVLRRKLAGDAQALERLDVMMREMDRLKHHMDQLINFGKPYKPEMRQTSVVEVIEETLLLLRRQLEHARITVVKSYADNLPHVFVDPVQLRQVLLNIIINSMQAMAKSGTLTVSAGLAKVEGETVCTIAIEDTGPGIPAEIRERIFEPFFSTRKAGTGLGLAIAKKIVEAHGGRIRFVSTDKGTIFRLFLPISPKGRRLTEVPTSSFKPLEGSDEPDTGD